MGDFGALDIVLVAIGIAIACNGRLGARVSSKSPQMQVVRSQGRDRRLC